MAFFAREEHIRHGGKKMKVEQFDCKPLLPEKFDSELREIEYEKVVGNSPRDSSFNRLMTQSDPRHLGKRIHQPRPKDHVNLFEGYGRYPAEIHHHGNTHDYDEATLRAMMDDSVERNRERDTLDTFVDAQSLFQRSMLGAKTSEKKPKRELSWDAMCSLKQRARQHDRGFVQDLHEKSERGRHEGKRMHPELVHSIRKDDPSVDPPIPGFSGVGIGNEEHFSTTRWRERKPKKPEDYDPLGVKSRRKKAEDDFGPHKSVKVVPTQAEYLLPHNPEMAQHVPPPKAQATKHFPDRATTVLSPFKMIPGFAGMGTGYDLTDKPAGMRHVRADQVRERRAPHRMLPLMEMRACSSLN